MPIHKAAAEALKAGADVLLIGKGDPARAAAEIARQVRSGAINETRLNDAYYKVLEAKRNDMRKRLFEAQDNVEDRKDELLNAVEARLRQTVEEERLFVVRWRVV